MRYLVLILTYNIIQDTPMSIENRNTKREEIREFEKQRKRLINLLLDSSELIEGSLRDALIKCGKKGCHCEQKPVHPVTRLSRWEKGKLINKLIRIPDREWVKKLSDNYKKHKQAFNEIVQINNKEKELLKNMIKLKNVKYE